MKASPSVRANVTDDGLVLLHIDQGKIFSSNTTARHSWPVRTAGSTRGNYPGPRAARNLTT